MNYFYSTRRDKRQNVLMTSYETKTMVEKHGGGGKVEHTVYYINPKTGAIGTEPSEGSFVMRSYLRNDGEIEELPDADEVGRFVVWVKSDGKWSQSKHSFNAYGEANNCMKNLVDYYESVGVIDNQTSGKILKSPPSDYDDLSVITPGTEDSPPWN